MSAAPLEVDLVNAALLGTDRRRVPAPTGTDPARWLLEAAGRRRAESLVAGATSTVPPAPAGPAPSRPAPSVAARAILDELLLTGSAVLLDLWLRESLDAGTGLAPEHWTPVLERARRATDLDRRRLGAALGPRGLWFARHNPAWSAVVRAAERPAGSGAGAAEDLELLAGDPGRLLTLPDPWSDAVGRVAVEVLAGEALPARAARVLGQRVGGNLPLDAYGWLTGLAAASSGAAARAGLAAAEELLWLRWYIAHALDPSRVPPERRPVPLAPVPKERR